MNYSNLIFALIVFMPIIIALLLLLIADVRYEFYSYAIKRLLYLSICLIIIFTYAIKDSVKKYICFCNKIKAIVKYSVENILKSNFYKNDFFAHNIINIIYCSIVTAIAVCTIYTFAYLYQQRVEYMNINCICKKTSRINTKDELLYSAVIDDIRKHFERYDKVNKFNLWSGFDPVTENWVVSKSSMTKEDLREKLKSVFDYCGLEHGDDKACLARIIQLGFEPIATVDRFAEYVENKPIIAYYKSINSGGGLIAYFIEEQSVMTEDEAIQDGMLYPSKSDSLRTGYYPEIAKKNGYANYYYKNVGYYYSFKENTYSNIMSRYYPLSNCGKVYRFNSKKCPEDDLYCDTIFLLNKNRR